MNNEININDEDIFFTDINGEVFTIIDQLNLFINANKFIKDVLRKEPFLSYLRDTFKKAMRINDQPAIIKMQGMVNTYDIPITLPGVRKQLPVMETQSVHTFMDETKEKVTWVISTYPATYTRPFNHDFIDFIERYNIEIIDGITLVDILASILKFIDSSKEDDKKEMISILKKEMDYGGNTCVSGHLTAMINSIMGFPGVPNFRGSIYQNEKMEVYNYINNKINFSDVDNLLVNIETLMNKGPLTSNTTAILKEYTYHDWVIENNILKLKVNLNKLN